MSYFEIAALLVGTFVLTIAYMLVIAAGLFFMVMGFLYMIGAVEKLP